MALLDPLYRVSEICSYLGIENAIVCPGSRSAALTLAFNRNEKINTQVIVDERSAAFVALGMAQVSQKPVVLICTSGTAALDFAPAVAEAFFQKIPLLVLTADRPPEWINQHDGQTIFQRDIFGKHIVKAYEFPVSYEHEDSIWQIERVTHEAIAQTQKGPVHINVPIREPFYPIEGEAFSGEFRTLNYVFGRETLNENQWEDFLESWNSARNIYIAVGQNFEDLDKELDFLNQDKRVSVWSDVISNVQIENKISSQDTFLPHFKENAPDLLITLGQSFISKSFKQFFRKNKPKTHWHISSDIELIDPLQTITHKVIAETKWFLQNLSSKINIEKKGISELISKYENPSQDFLKNYIDNMVFSEIKLIKQVISTLKNNSLLHLGNSMPIRYANILQAFLSKNVKVFSNRGTSGIDGIVSTALGHALVTDKEVSVLVGDVSFFYDSNAMFAARPSNLNIYLLNNGGGNIFRIIDGPRKQDELVSHFVTPPHRTARGLAFDAGYEYVEVRSLDDLENKKEGKATLFEIFLDGEQDANLFRKMKSDFTL